jgi:hypothetical protein
MEEHCHYVPAGSLERARDYKPTDGAGTFKLCDPGRHSIIILYRRISPTVTKHVVDTINPVVNYLFVIYYDSSPGRRSVRYDYTVY